MQSDGRTIADCRLATTRCYGDAMRKRIALAFAGLAVAVVALWSGSQVQTITGVTSGGGLPHDTPAPTCRGGTVVWTNWTPCVPMRVPMPAYAP